MSAPTKLGETSPRIRCHACSGWFSLGYADGDEQTGTPTCFHSLPYCDAFDRIESVLDAVAFSEACRAEDAGKRNIMAKLFDPEPRKEPPS